MVQFCQFLRIFVQIRPLLGKKSLKVILTFFDDNYTFCGLDICRKGDYSHDVPQRFLQHGLLWLLPLSQEPLPRGCRQTIRLGVKEQFREIFEDPKIYCNSVGIGFFTAFAAADHFLVKKAILNLSIF